MRRLGICMCCVETGAFAFSFVVLCVLSFVVAPGRCASWSRGNHDHVIGAFFAFFGVAVVVMVVLGLGRQTVRSCVCGCYCVGCVGLVCMVW